MKATGLLVRGCVYLGLIIKAFGCVQFTCDARMCPFLGLRICTYKIITKYSLGILMIYLLQRFKLIIGRGSLIASEYHWKNVKVARSHTYPWSSFYGSGSTCLTAPSLYLNLLTRYISGCVTGKQSGRTQQIGSRAENSYHIRCKFSYFPTRIETRNHIYNI